MGDAAGNPEAAPKLRRVCVFCGSRDGARPEYRAAAEQLGRELVQRGLGLVYGGGTVGLMGAVAKTVAAAGGHVHGVIPEALLPREVSGDCIGEVVVVKDMHERKAAMARAADAFVALPGGFGTMEELLEMITWLQLGVHTKPVAVLNVAGYFDHLLKFFDHSVDEGFVKMEQRQALICSISVSDLLDRISDHKTTHKSIVPKENWELGYRLATSEAGTCQSRSLKHQ